MTEVKCMNHIKLAKVQLAWRGDAAGKVRVRILEEGVCM